MKFNYEIKKHNGFFQIVVAGFGVLAQVPNAEAIEKAANVVCDTLWSKLTVEYGATIADKIMLAEVSNARS